MAFISVELARRSIGQWGLDMRLHDKVFVIGIPLLIVFEIITHPHGHPAGIALIFGVSGVLAWILTRMFAGFLFNPALPSGFTADYRSRNIALDLNRGLLWVRPDQGSAREIHKGELRNWAYNYTSVTNVWGMKFKVKNTLDLQISDMHRPSYTVNFRNSHDAEAWHSRLNNWVNG
jgi:hypothetical protein